MISCDHNSIVWEQRKFSDVGSVSMCKRVFKEQTSVEGDIPFFKIGTFGGEPDAFISRELFEDYKAKFSYPKAGDILLSASGTIGRIVEYNGEEAYFQDSNIVWLSHDDSISNSFLKVLYPTVKWDGIEGSTIQRLYNENFLKTKFMMPSRDEQDKLGEYFGNLDNLITLHQRKLFQQIQESSVWEQRKLGEIADKVTAKNTGTQYVETLTNSAEFGIISQRDFFDHDVSNMENIDGYYIVENDAFVYNPRISTTAPVGPINRNKLGRAGVMSPLYTVFKTHDIDPEYLEWFFKSTKWHPFMKFNGDSGARSDRFSIKDAVFFDMPIPTPDIVEQKRIGKYFTEIDNLITLHRRA